MDSPACPFGDYGEYKITGPKGSWERRPADSGASGVQLSKYRIEEHFIIQAVKAVILGIIYQPRLKQYYFNYKLKIF